MAVSRGSQLQDGPIYQRLASWIVTGEQLKSRTELSERLYYFIDSNACLLSARNNHLEWKSFKSTPISLSQCAFIST